MSHETVTRPEVSTSGTLVPGTEGRSAKAAFRRRRSRIWAIRVALVVLWLAEGILADRTVA